MEARPTPDSFGTFLKTLQSHGVSEREARQDPQLYPDMLGDSLKILANLADTGSRPVTELLERSGVGFSRFSEVLKLLESQSLVNIVGEPGQESVKITPEGEQIARSMRAG
jgi:predicted transcriptional regulator